MAAKKPAAPKLIAPISLDVETFINLICFMCYYALLHEGVKVEKPNRDHSYLVHKLYPVANQINKLAQGYGAKGKLTAQATADQLLMSRHLKYTNRRKLVKAWMRSIGLGG